MSTVVKHIGKMSPGFLLQSFELSPPAAQQPHPRFHFSFPPPPHPPNVFCFRVKAPAVLSSIQEKHAAHLG